MHPCQPLGHVLLWVRTGQSQARGVLANGVPTVTLHCLPLRPPRRQDSRPHARAGKQTQARDDCAESNMGTACRQTSCCCSNNPLQTPGEGVPSQLAAWASACRHCLRDTLLFPGAFCVAGVSLGSGESAEQTERSPTLPEPNWRGTHGAVCVGVCCGEPVGAGRGLSLKRLL